VEALRRWKNKEGLGATYANLLDLFMKARHQKGVEALMTVLNKKYSS
jgi:hypothetical protein